MTNDSIRPDQSCLVPCFSTLGCPGLDLDGAVALARSAGIRTLELRALGGTVDLPAHFAERYGTPDRLAEAGRQIGLQVSAIGTSLRLIGNTAETRAAFLCYVPWAIALGTPLLRVFDGGADASEAEFVEAAATLAWWDTLKAEHGWPIDIMVETHDALVHPQPLQRFIDRHPGRKLLWDSHHTWRRGGECPVQTWHRVRAATVHVHVKDSIGLAGHHADHSYVPLGTGEFPIRELLETLAADGFAGAVSLEWERLWHDDLAPLDTVLPGFTRWFA